MDPFAPEPPPKLEAIPQRPPGDEAVGAQNMLILSASTALGIAILSLALAMPDALESIDLRAPMMCYMFGTSVGISILAALWCTLGPGPFGYRVPLSLLGMAGVTLGWLGNCLLHKDGPPVEAAVVMGLAASALWIVPQLPLWCFRFLARVSVALPDSSATSERNQFGILQLIIFTTIVAILLGVARVASRGLGNDSRAGEPIMAFVFLVTSGMFLFVPLALAMLIPRYSLIAVLFVMVLVTLTTFWQAPLANVLIGSSGGMPDDWFFIWLNAFTAAWILILTGIARLCGYRLVRSK